MGEQPEVKGEQELGGELGENLVPGLLHKFCIKLHFCKYTCKLVLDTLNNVARR